MGLPVIVIFRYVSLGSVVGAILAVVSMSLLAIPGPALYLGVPSLIYLLYPFIGAPLLIFRHRDNIRRLLKGQESKLGESARVSDPSVGSHSPDKAAL